VHRRLLKMALEDLDLIEKQMGQLDQEIADLLHPHQDQVQRLAEVPGLGVHSAQQIIAEVGATAASTEPVTRLTGLRSRNLIPLSVQPFG